MKIRKVDTSYFKETFVYSFIAKILESTFTVLFYNKACYVELFVASSFSYDYDFDQTVFKTPSSL